ncbi:MAG: hypothetical protein IKY22_09055 [Bacteroidales bacterium]|nr:hypothetical protein [Bacteroidales bacterium]
MKVEEGIVLWNCHSSAYWSCVDFGNHAGRCAGMVNVDVRKGWMPMF